MPFARKVTILILTWLCCSTAMAETLKDAVSARMLTDQVMAKVGKGEVGAGILLTKQYMIIPPAEFDVMLGQLKMQEPAMALRFGKTIGHEFIREEKVGENLMRIVHLHRFEKHAMRWSFYFYRGPAGWVLNTFKTDDDLGQLFEK